MDVRRRIPRVTVPESMEKFVGETCFQRLGLCISLFVFNSVFHTFYAITATDTQCNLVLCR